MVRDSDELLAASCEQQNLFPGNSPLDTRN